MELLKNRSLHSLLARVSQSTESGDLNRSLQLISDFVERIFTEPLCTSQVVGSKALDDFCQRIGKVNLATIMDGSVVAKPEKIQPVFVYLVTKMQKSGGHSRIIVDFIKARPWARHVVLSSEMSGRSDADSYLMKELAERWHVTFELARKRDNYQQRLTWLQKRLLEICPRKLYLFNHHQDSVAVAAAQLDMGFDISFYHHGDHHLSLGACLSNVEHIDPHPMGYQICRNELGITNTYVPLTTDDLGTRDFDWPFMGDETLTTCTAARSNKIEIPYFVSYLEVIPQLLNATGGKHIHIGRLSLWARFKINRGLKRLGVPYNKFVYIPWVPSVWKALHYYRVDLYVASFPYGGGLTLIEAMGAGVPVALHHHIFSPVLSSIDLAPPDAFIWRSPAELLNFCVKVTREYLRENGQQARKQYLTYHRQKIIVDILEPGNGVAITPRDMCGRFQPERDEYAAWMECQVSIRHIIYRSIYRYLRSVRSKYF